MALIQCGVGGSTYLNLFPSKSSWCQPRRKRSWGPRRNISYLPPHTSNLRMEDLFWLTVMGTVQSLMVGKDDSRTTKQLITSGSVMAQREPHAGPQLTSFHLVLNHGPWCCAIPNEPFLLLTCFTQVFCYSSGMLTDPNVKPHHTSC